MFAQRYFLEVDNEDDEDGEVAEEHQTEEGNTKDENRYFFFCFSCFPYTWTLCYSDSLFCFTYPCPIRDARTLVWHLDTSI